MKKRDFNISGRLTSKHFLIQERFDSLEGNHFSAAELSDSFDILWKSEVFKKGWVRHQGASLTLLYLLGCR